MLTHLSLSLMLQLKTEFNLLLQSVDGQDRVHTKEYVVLYLNPSVDYLGYSSHGVMNLNCDD